MFVRKLVPERQHSCVVARWSAKRADNRSLLHQFIRVMHGNCQVRAAKVTENGEVHADDFAVAIEERSTGTARGTDYRFLRTIRNSERA